MNIHIALVAYALDISPLVVSLAGRDVTWHIFQHGQDPEIVDTCEALACNVPNVYYYDYRQNRGLARSWNEGLLISQAMDADVMVLLNDDIQASRADLMILTNAAVEHRESGIIEVQGYDGNMKRQQGMNFGFCAINPIALEEVGFYDEAYWPIYGEDVDYSYRCGLSGVTFFDAGPTGVNHLGSQTVKIAPELRTSNPLTFAANEQYHARKWGGGYGKEIWRLPFNSENFDRKITAENRHCPYPGYSEVVRL